MGPSIRLFWPEARITIVFRDDDESHEFARTLPKGYRIQYIRLHEELGVSWSNDRRRFQLLWLQVDQFSTAEYIGLVDADTLFTSWVTESSLFANSKPRVMARRDRPEHYTSYGPSVLGASSTPPLSCMPSSPIVLRREHVASLRKYFVSFQELHKMSSEDSHQHTSHWAFEDLLCDYLFQNHAEEYAFYVLDASSSRSSLSWLNIIPVARVSIQGSQMLSAVSTAQPGIDTRCMFDMGFNCHWF